ncbi:MAG: class I SAM-dependent methyltransferase [Chloroflexi bacterium]|nr:class I SAM-dependent methyltransferase [Chloroflexota bacterium]
MKTSPGSVHDPFAFGAPFYDLDLEGYDEDVALYERLADAGWHTVLELGCGTGRVTAALARRGLTVTGVDISAAMLALAGERVADLPHVELIEADMCGLALGAVFDAVVVPLGGLQHLESVDAVVEAMETIARHLAEDGLAVIDVEAPHADDFTPGPQPLTEHWTRAWAVGGDALVTKLVSVDARPSEGVRDVTWHFDVQSSEGALRRVTEQFTLRTLTPGELALAARVAGLSVTGLFGTYELDPFADGDARLIVTLEHAADEADGR